MLNQSPVIAITKKKDIYPPNSPTPQLPDFQTSRLKSMPLSFQNTLIQANTSLTRSKPEILQINTGKLCNLTCVHCHVNAGPARKEIMTDEVIDRIITWFETTDIPTLDLTGGTPEMIPGFRRLVDAVRAFDQPREVMTRLNATIINEPGYEWIPEYHASHGITIIASMPCYSPENVNSQRGDGVFDSSINAFHKLNALGYGRDPKLPMHFVYNPNGAALPPDQKELEADYKREMKQHFDIDFNDLFCITNMPIARFASYLKNNGQLEEYNQLLRESFNPTTVEGLMCRNTINTSWTGEVFDCDFNQMLKMGLKNNTTQEPLMVWDIDTLSYDNIPIQTANHCFGCTAGHGSSCSGSLE